MLKFGTEPFLECSSKGDKRFSAFYAFVTYQGIKRSIEEHYQRAKALSLGIHPTQWRKAKGKQSLNMTELRRLYTELWNLYFEQNPGLIEVITKYNGFSDIFGQQGHACQAEEIYRINKDWSSK